MRLVSGGPSCFTVVSSCKEGTVLKGLNVLKDGKDPVAKADSGYPAWLWTLLDPKEPPVEKKDQLSIHHLRSLSREKIRAFALSKQTKY
ncbi:hypothetical protein HK105_209009 [Polyrhizophydium stewartii]|uniref:Large ribosomal subunit protein mL54 n=1 Tax=Polyrhizophydium stewartii TaxID=2732419 RepID=A0ABR4MW71_9FUNG|nr:39S ribosomal protein L37, mitochondrial [Polyrhizophydium stewartii]